MVDWAIEEMRHAYYAKIGTKNIKDMEGTMIMLPSTVPEGRLNLNWSMAEMRQDYFDKIGEEMARKYTYRDWEYWLPFAQGEFKEDDIVLDVGGACSHFLIYLAHYVKQGFLIDNCSTSAQWWDAWHDDVSKYEAYKSGRVCVIGQNAAELPFKDKFFDKIVSVSALEHFDNADDTLASKEIYRTLKDDGYFLGTVDFHPTDEYPQKQFPENRFYTYDSFFNRVVNPAGFKLCAEYQRMEQPSPPFLYSPMFFKLRK
jgi:SAM-dependent methyltransferase